MAGPCFLLRKQVNTSRRLRALEWAFFWGKQEAQTPNSISLRRLKDKRGNDYYLLGRGRLKCNIVTSVFHLHKSTRLAVVPEMKVLKKTGSYLRNKALRRLSISILLMIIFVLGVVSEIPLSPIYVNVGNYEGVRALFLLSILVFAWLFYRSYSGYRRGYEGEKTVTKILQPTLGDEYFLINDVYIHDDYGNVDHIVLGPNGVFVIETKNFAGKIVCDGDEWSVQHAGRFNRLIHHDFGSPSRQVKRNAVRVKRMIESIGVLNSSKIWVEGILVFANKRVDLRIKNPTVPVLRASELPKFLTSRKAINVFSAEELKLMGREILRQK